jgi:TFIIF-interacting CTD phosphatase-like protein
MSDKRLNVFLDLDQTLIAAVPLVNEDDDEDDDEKIFDLYNPDDQKRATLFEFENMDDYYIIFQRPGLQKFLDYLFSNFNVSVWTAASQGYAAFIVDRILIGNKKKERKIDYTFFSYHCKASCKVKKGTKDLSILWDIYKFPGYNKDNTIIIDDYDEVCNTQPKNCIVAPPFYFTKKGSEKDDFLEKLIPRLDKIKDRLLKGKKLHANKH